MKGHKKSPVQRSRPNRAIGQISPQDIVSVLIVAREKGKGKMLKPQQLTRRRNDLERAVRGAMGRALIRTGKELGEEIGLSETQICNRMAGRSRWTLAEQEAFMPSVSRYAREHGMTWEAAAAEMEGSNGH